MANWGAYVKFDSKKAQMQLVFNLVLGHIYAPE